MERWTTFDVQKIMGIKRNRIKEWIDRGYIIPTAQEKTGTGMKSYFSKWGLYCLRFFDQLLRDGFSREAASKWVALVHGLDPENPHPALTETWDLKNMPTLLELQVRESVGRDVYEHRFVWGHGFRFPEDCRAIYITNFERLRREVDALLE